MPPDSPPESDSPDRLAPPAEGHSGLGRRLVLIAGALLLAAAGYGLYRGTLSGVATWHTTLAREDLARGEQAEALERLETAVAWDPHHASAQLLLAHAELGHGRLDAARTRLEGRLDRGHVELEVLDALGRIHEESGRAAEARALFQEASERYPADLSGALGLARLGDPTELRARLVEPGPDSATPNTPPPIVRGVAFFHLDDGFGTTGYGTPASVESLRRARAAGANLISLRVPARQPDVRTPNLIYGHEPAGGETERAVKRVIRDAHLLGFRVLIKPHVMLETIDDDEWRGTIAFEDERQLEAWWNDYRSYILYVAILAAEHDVEFLAVGVELRSLVRDSPERWRKLIAAVREVYPGHVTYAANWFHEFAEVSFWDALDSIGVQFFFPVEATPSGGGNSASELDRLVQALSLPTRDIAELAYLLDRPVLLTEVGYRSTTTALAEPWAWPSAEEEPDEAVQALAYRAVLTIFEDQPWCAGLIWWNWLTTPEPSDKFEVDFTPQGKAAEAVIRESWRQ